MLKSFCITVQVVLNKDTFELAGTLPFKQHVSMRNVLMFFERG